jgi:magnesium transporter
MTNTLFLPELREMLATGDEGGLCEFCTALHPARTVEFMEGLEPAEAWQVLLRADPATRVELFRYFDPAKQVAIVEKEDRAAVAELIQKLAPDERVDILKQADATVVAELLPLVPADVRRDIQRLIAYPEGTAGAIMTTSFASIHERSTVREALSELAQQAEHLETIYYLYVVDADDHLRGVVSSRTLISAMVRPDTPIAELMDRSVVTAEVTEDQEEVARKVARYDFLAIPIVDHEHHLLGIITHDDVLDVLRDEAIEDAQRIGGVQPLEQGYLDTPLITLAWKRGMWLTIIFLGGLLTALALHEYNEPRNAWPWLAIFLPLIIASGGNTGSQSATLIITALAAGHLGPKQWLRVALRELLSGILLGGLLATIGYVIAFFLLHHEARTNPAIPNPASAALVVPATLLLVATFGTLCGAMLPLLFYRLGWDPALMSTPFISGIVDIIGIVIYMNVAMYLLSLVIP